MRALGVIPARGGSKGLPGKNLMKVGGKTLIQWAIDSAMAAKTLDHIVVTSDIPEVLALAARHSHVLALSRPPHLATDECGMVPVLQHAADASRWREPHDLVVCLQPTSPFRTGEDIDQTVALITEGVYSAQSVVRAPYCPGHVMVIREGRRAEFPTFQHARGDHRRQDCNEFYIPNGAVYAVRRDVLMLDGLVITEAHRVHVMPPERSVNINTELDLRIARMLAHRTPESA